MSGHYIKQIEIKHFKCFNSLHDSFNAEGFKRVNLIGGKNNVGKTALLEACYLAESGKKFQIDQLHRDYLEFFHALLVIELNRNPLKEIEIVNDSNRFDFKYTEAQISINGQLRQIIPFDEHYGEQQKHLYLKPAKNYQEGIEEIQNFYQGDGKGLNLSNHTFVSLCSLRHDFLVFCIDELKLADHIDKINQLLNELFNVENIDVIKSKIMLKTHGQYVDLYEFGDGLKHFISIIVSIYLNIAVVVYLDEIESGLHFSHYDQLWTIIFKLSFEQNVQVFATTHSKECIESYARVSKKLQEKEITYVDMGRDKQGDIQALTMNFDRFHEEMSMGNEVRGW
jgi:predicted ATP-dependent endonuclease of OLD family